MTTKLLEGGNVFKDANKQSLTRRITREEIPGTIAFLEKITGLDFTMDKDEEGVPIKWLGTTGRKVDSGDLDLSVDASEISKDDLVSALASAGFDKTAVKKTGDSVHLKTPINGNAENGFAQTDFPVWQVPVALIGLFGLRGMGVFLSQVAVAKATNQGLIQLRLKMFERLQNADLTLFKLQTIESGHGWGQMHPELPGELGNRGFITMGLGQL
jgi:hypothetical protein